MDRISEKDWKQLRKMEKEKLARACEIALDEFKRIIDTPNGEPHAVYLKLFQATRAEDKKIASMFDDLKRSAAIFNLVNWYRYGILSDSELEQFTPETRNRVRTFAQ